MTACTFTQSYISFDEEKYYLLVVIYIIYKYIIKGI